MTTWITVCDTCKRQDWTGDGSATDGEVLAGLVEAAAKGLDPHVVVRRHACLMGCTRACNVTIQAPDKIAYSLGTFAADATAAAAIVAYATRHAESATGQVPYRTWPDGVKGHFVSRHLPIPET